MRAYPGRLADDGHIDMIDLPAARFDQAARMPDEAGRGRAATLGVAWREMIADIAFADRAQEGVGERVQTHIGAPGTGKRTVKRDADAREHNDDHGSEDTDETDSRPAWKWRV